MRHLVSAVCALLLATTSPGPLAAAKAEDILGVWHGFSKCTDLERAPACKDEEVVYTFSATEEPGKVLMKADKIVRGVREPMGELVFSFDAHANRWWHEYQNPLVHFVWEYTLDGDRLSGTATEIPSQAVLRRVTATRSVAGG
jgi:hypothetical protein